MGENSIKLRHLAALLGVIGGLIVVAAGVMLLLIASYQNPGSSIAPRILYDVFYLGLPSIVALAAAVSLWKGRPSGRAVLVAVAIGLIIVGVPAIFSIGYPLLLASLLMVAAGFVGGRPSLWPAVLLSLAGATLGVASFPGSSAQLVSCNQDTARRSRELWHSTDVTVLGTGRVGGHSS